MGHIRKEELHESLINELNEIGNANNELLAEAKELIANAVGEPLTAQDSFSKMSNDINNLTSDFKIGLMNGGMAVESTDRFQDLILKMKEMVKGDIDVDTALFDSLKSILEEKGVEILEEDDMATLITKAETELNDKNNEISSLQTELAGKVTPAGTAVAANVLTGKTFINSTGSTITGNMANNGAKTFTPSASKQTSGAGYYSGITCNAVANLSAANIKQGVVVGGVTGTCVPGYTLSSSPSYGDAIAGAMLQSSEWCKRGTTILSYTSKFAGKVRVCIPLYKLSSSVYSSEILTFMVNGASKQVITLDTHLSGTGFAFSTVYSDLTINKGDVVTVIFDGSEYSGATIYRVGWFILCTFV